MLSSSSSSFCARVPVKDDVPQRDILRQAAAERGSAGVHDRARGQVEALEHFVASHHPFDPAPFFDPAGKPGAPRAPQVVVQEVQLRQTACPAGQGLGQGSHVVGLVVAAPAADPIHPQAQALQRRVLAQRPEQVVPFRRGNHVPGKLEACKRSVFVLDKWVRKICCPSETSVHLSITSILSDMLLVFRPSEIVSAAVGSPGPFPPDLTSFYFDRLFCRKE